LFVGLRYLRASKGSGFVSFVTFASVVGVSLGVATLIVVLSVMNGFEAELRDRLLGLTSHASLLVEPIAGEWEPLADQLAAQPGVTGVAPFVEHEVMVTGVDGMSAAIVTGIVPAYEQSVSRVHQAMLLGQMSDLQPASDNIVLGRVLARKLGVAVGDRVGILVPRFLVGGQSEGGPRLISFVVSGVFELGVQDHDSVRAFVNFQDAARLGGTEQGDSGLRILSQEVFTAPKRVRAAVAEVDPALVASVRDWTEQNASYFRAIKIEKLIMALLLSLIIGVAAFNIVATLVMVVNEKRGGIAILRTMGFSRREVIAVFVLQGTLIGWFGAIVGITSGVWLALNIDTVAPALERVLGFQFMPADLYYLTSLPAELQLGDVVGISVTVLLLTSLATIYPALRAASVHPAEVLRYE